MTLPAWAAELEAAAPDVVACWALLDEGLSPGAGLRRLRRALRERVDDGSAQRILVQQEAVADALEAVLRAMPDDRLRAPGGEEDWNVAEAFAHTTAARRFLSAWAAMGVPAERRGGEAAVVTPSVPGRPDATREELLTLLDKSRRSMRQSAAAMEGHETERNPLDHPLVGHLRTGEWLLFVGVHDLMHLEQLHRLLGDA